ncbi:MAG: trimeric autotransporter adhesin [Patescibacteria group bacterium]|nr:trimeric autotransporter adhesin [Patescibacteria group bacterium]
MYKRLLRFVFAVGLFAGVSVVFAASGHAAPATFTVTNTNDSGAGSLRQAMMDANSNGNPSDIDSIEFNISGSGVQVITPIVALPAISESLTINGYTQPGSSENTSAWGSPINANILIEINGENVDDNGLATNANNVTIKGLAINRFKVGVAASAPGCSGLNVQGNYIGSDAAGLQDFGNTHIGVQVFCSNTTIGGPNAADRNLVVGNNTLNIQFFALGAVAPGWENNGSIIQGNYIGATKNLTSISGVTQGLGVLAMGDAAEILVGGTNVGEGNIIRDVEGVGVATSALRSVSPSFTIYPSKITILGNSIRGISNFNYPNFGQSNLGIDHGLYEDNNGDGDPDLFEQYGPQANDPSDIDTGANNLINTPVLKTAQQIGNDLTITYDLDAADSPSNTYRIEFFANNEATIFGAGPGEEYLGAATAVTPGTNKTITLTVSGDYTDKALSATTTAIDGTTASGFGSTSEFSQNISIGSAADFDADGIADSVEDAGPNNGDSNNDGTPDRLQPTVTTYEIDSTGIYATLVTSGCSENGTVASVDVTSLAKTDNGKAYPYGLTDFTLNCSRGDTVDVTMYIHAETNPNQYVPRKYNATTQTFFDIPGSALTNEQVGASSALKLNYSITDGGELDDDGLANGIIVDPVGLALTVTGATGTLASTGENLLLLLLGAGTLMVGGVWLSRKALKK